MHSEKWLWTTSTWGEAFSFVQALSCCSCFPACGNTPGKSVVNSFGFAGNKNPHSWVPAWAFPFWPSWLAASIWVSVLHIFIRKLHFWPTTPFGCLHIWCLWSRKVQTLSRTAVSELTVKSSAEHHDLYDSLFSFAPLPGRVSKSLESRCKSNVIVCSPSFSRCVYVLRTDQVQLCVSKGHA